MTLWMLVRDAKRALQGVPGREDQHMMAWAGDSLRLTAQLIDVTSGQQIKALHLDRSLQDIFSIEDKIADSVAAVLALRMGEARFRPEQARNVILSAYLEYLVNKAISLDGGLGEAYLERAVLERDATRAEADFRKGLDLSRSYGLGYTYFAEILFNLNRHEEAQRVFDHAIRIDPLSPRAPYIKATLK